MRTPEVPDSTAVPCWLSLTADAWHVHCFAPSAAHREVTMKARVTSVPVQARDGTRLAVDVILPTEGERFPAVVNQGRYWRSFLGRGQKGGPSQSIPLSEHYPKSEDLVEAGFAVVNADVRGTGASEGNWPIMWSVDEANDAYDLVAWIAEQPWCDGRVLAAGLSYEGTTAVLAASCGHPAMLGGVARGFEWDIYDDIVAPGGVVNEGFMQEWAESVRDLDRNKAPTLFGIGRFFVKGARPLDDDPHGEALQALADARTNCDVWACVSALRSGDDPWGDSGTSLNDVSLCSQERVRAHEAPMQLWGSWVDGTTSRTMLRIFEHAPSVREVYIGAWSHTGREGTHLGDKVRPDPALKDQLALQMDFLRALVDGDPGRANRERVIHYFTMGEDQWHQTTAWPPPGTTVSRWLLSADARITPDPNDDAPPSDVEHRAFHPDTAATTGRKNRWHTQNAKPFAVTGRKRAADHLLVWRSPPLDHDLVITGEPELHLSLRASYDTPAVFAYLELVDTRGDVHYVTEAIGRSPADAGDQARLNLVFYPTSVRIPAGWSLQVGLAGTDADTFPQALPADARWEVALGGETEATLHLPVEGARAPS
jgi:putative CocE/NonD family hydrolase